VEVDAELMEWKVSQACQQPLLLEGEESKDLQQEMEDSKDPQWEMEDSKDPQWEMEDSKDPQWEMEDSKDPQMEIGLLERDELIWTNLLQWALT
jgi:hypothetical protein